MSKTIPSEEIISSNWDKCLENLVYNVSIGFFYIINNYIYLYYIYNFIKFVGTIVGGVTSLVLASKFYFYFNFLNNYSNHINILYDFEFYISSL